MSIAVRLAVVYGINVLALIVVDWLFDGISIGRWGSLLWAAVILTIGHLIIKPILATYIGATIVVWLVNVVVGWLLDRIVGDQDDYY